MVQVDGQKLYAEQKRIRMLAECENSRKGRTLNSQITQQWMRDHDNVTHLK